MWMFRRNSDSPVPNDGLVVKVYTKLLAGASSFKVISCSNTETVQTFCEICIVKFNIQSSAEEYEIYSVEHKEDGNQEKNKISKI